MSLFRELKFLFSSKKNFCIHYQREYLGDCTYYGLKTYRLKTIYLRQKHLWTPLESQKNASLAQSDSKTLKKLKTYLDFFNTKICDIFTFRPLDDSFAVYKVSYLFYTLIGASVTIIVAFLVSFVIGLNDLSTMDEMLFAPFLRGLIKRRKELAGKISDIKKSDRKDLHGNGALNDDHLDMKEIVTNT